jgi:hypothetical protein
VTVIEMISGRLLGVVVLLASLLGLASFAAQNAAAAQNITINNMTDCTNAGFIADTNGCTINNLNLQSGDTLNIGMQGVAVRLGTNGVNGGTINIGTNSILYLPGTALTNNGVINVAGGVLYSAWNDQNLAPGNLINNNLVQLTSNGQIGFHGGTLTDNGMVTIDNSRVSGIFEDLPDGTQGQATPVVASGGTIQNAGTISVYGLSVNQGGTVTSSNQVSAHGPISNSGTFSSSGQVFADTFNNNGHFTLTSSGLIDARFFNNNSPGITDIYSSQFNIGAGSANYAPGTFQNNGGATINNHGSMNFFGGIANYGLWKNYGAIHVDNETPIYNPGTLIDECGSTPTVDIINGIQQVFPNGVENGCVPPTITISSPSNNAFLNTNSLTVSGTASGNFAITTVTWSVDNGASTTATGTNTWSFTTGHLSDGIHTISVTATDNNGNTATRSVTITIDTDLPTLTLPSSQIIVQATGPNGAAVTYSVSGSDTSDGTLTPICSPVSSSIFSLGSHQVNCSVTDQAGNVASGSFTVIVQDTIPPAVSISSPQNNTYLNTNTFSISGTSSDSGSGVKMVQISIDNGPFQPATSGTTSWTFAIQSPLSEGIHTIVVQAIDNAGNIATTPATTIVVDTIPPAVVGTPDRQPNANGWYNVPVTISWSGTDGGSGMASCSAPTVYSGPDGNSISLVGHCTDKAGNVGTATVNLHYDSTPPTITGAATTSPNSNGWYNHDVIVHFTASDSLSGISTVTPDVTLAQDEANQQVTGIATDNAGNTASFTVTGINIDKTGPSVTILSILPPPNANGWNNSPVVVQFSAADSLSGIAGPSTQTFTLSSEGAGQSASATFSDKAGNLASLTSAKINIDLTPPTITTTLSPLPNSNGWNNSTVTVTFSCSDALSGVATCPAPVTVSKEGANQLVSGVATDNAGNTATASANINLDTTPPTITGAATTSPNSNGWYNHDVIVHFTATDSLSGLASVTPDTTISTEGSGQSVTGTATDNAGNTASFTVTGINIDKTPPVLTVSSNIVVYPTSTSGASVSYPPATATDNLTPTSSIVITYSAASGSAFAIGNTTVTVTATDLAGNSVTGSFTIAVLTPAQATASTVTTIQNMNIQQGIANSLVSQLQSALTSINAGKNTQAANQLDAFINHVQAQSGKHLTTSQANQLIADAQNIINSLPH